MKRYRMTIAMMGLFCVCFAPGVRADDLNKETHLTINVPLRVQDTVLAPGEYVFKLIDLAGGPGVVGIFNSKGSHLETIMIGLPAYREDAGDSKLFTIADPQGDQPATLRSWFYPGDNFGVEFHSAKRVSDTTHVSGTNGKGQNIGKADAAVPAGN
jgi:hypothetical protein